MCPLSEFTNLAPGDGVPGAITGLGRGTARLPPGIKKTAPRDEVREDITSNKEDDHTYPPININLAPGEGLPGALHTNTQAHAHTQHREHTDTRTCTHMHTDAHKHMRTHTPA